MADKLEKQAAKIQAEKQLPTAPGGSGGWQMAGKGLQALGEGLRGFSSPFLGMEYKPLERQAPEFTKAWSDFQSRQKFEAWAKNQQGQELSDYEQKLLGLDIEKKPSEWDLWKQAEGEALHELGGGAMIGLQPSKQGLYRETTEEKFYNLKKRFNLETPETKVKRAKYHLKRQGYNNSDQATSIFIKNNPGF